MQDLQDRTDVVRFAAVATLGLLVDVAAFHALVAAGAGVGTAHLASFAAAAIVNYGAFRAAGSERRQGTIATCAACVTVALLAVFLRGGVLDLCQRGLGLDPGLAIVPAAVVAAAVDCMGIAFLVFRLPERFADPQLRWRAAAVGVAVYMFTLRLVYSGAVELVSQEAYYWNYAQHLDIGYLDHPPLVAWLIWLGTAVFGDTEFGVRAGALAASVVALVAMVLLTRNLLGRTQAWIAAMLVASLPFFIGAGFLMTPDAPLVACWAGALYFLERSLRARKRWAWLGVGTCIGLGLVSKYTIALLGVAVVVYLVLDRPSRRWLRTPFPYLAGLVALAIFSPVLLWNARHDWASFAFQGPRRWNEMTEFALPRFLVFTVLLATPIGVAGFALGLARLAKDRLFGLVFTLVPLAVFAAASLHSETKLNWTGPAWLAAVPFMAASVTGLHFRRAWKITVLVLMVLTAAVLHASVLGLPGVPHNIGVYGMDWRELARQVEAIEHEVEAATGKEPLVVGLDRYQLAGVLAFYDPDGDGAEETTARSIIGIPSLMYDRWYRPPGPGRSVILVCDERKDLETRRVRSSFEELEPIRELVVRKDGAVVGTYFARVAHGHRPGDRSDAG